MEERKKLYILVPLTALSSCCLNKELCIFIFYLGPTNYVAGSAGSQQFGDRENKDQEMEIGKRSA